MEDSALLETIMVATEAKAEALLAAGAVSGTPTDAVIAASEGEIKHHYPPDYGPGRRVRDAVLKGIPEPCAGYESEGITDRCFSSTAGSGGHWVEWLPHNCPYYPCHFPGQVL